MEFDLAFTQDAQETLDSLEDQRLAKVRSCLGKLSLNPRHLGLNSHRYDVFDSVYGVSVWESYVENHTSSAWRVWWAYGPEQGQITVLMIAPHP